MIKYLLLPLFLLFATTALGGQFYKWRDAQGRLHFSDSPPMEETNGGAEKLNLVPNGSTRRPTIKPQPQSPAAAEENAKDAAGRTPQSLRPYLRFQFEEYQMAAIFHTDKKESTYSVRAALKGPPCNQLNLKFIIRNSITGSDLSVAGVTLYHFVGERDMRDYFSWEKNSAISTSTDFQLIGFIANCVD